MSFRFSIDEDANLLIFVYEGDVSPEEEAQAVHDVVADPRVKPNARILVDRTRSHITMTPEQTMAQIDLVVDNFSVLGQPKVAIVVSADYDFGMVRMFELSAEDRIPHEMMVFRDVLEACDWLGLDPATIVWP